MKARRLVAATMLTFYLVPGVMLTDRNVTEIEATTMYVTSNASPVYNAINSDAQRWVSDVISEGNLRTYYDIDLTENEQDIIRDIASSYELEFELVLSVCYVESRYDRYAFSGSSVGMMQIQPTWWESTFTDLGCSDWYDLEDNVRMGCYILRYLFNNYSQTSKVLSAYNTGNPDANNGYAEKVIKFKECLKEKKYAKYYSG